MPRSNRRERQVRALVLFTADSFGVLDGVGGACPARATVSVKVSFATEASGFPCLAATPGATT
jgi:hypothetical protein